MGNTAPLAEEQRRALGCLKAIPGTDRFYLAGGTYFADAEKESVLPSGLTTARWEAIKTYFRTEAPRLLQTA
jgi:hypothetical protein